MATNSNVLPSIQTSQKETEEINAPVTLAGIGETAPVAPKTEEPGVTTSSSVQQIPAGLGEPTPAPKLGALAKTGKETATAQTAPEGIKAFVRKAPALTPDQQVKVDADLQKAEEDRLAAEAKSEAAKKSKEDFELAAAKNKADADAIKKAQALKKTEEGGLSPEEIGLSKTLDDIYSKPMDAIQREYEIASHQQTKRLIVKQSAAQDALIQQLTEQNKLGNGIGNAFVKDLYMSSQSLVADANFALSRDYLNQVTKIELGKASALEEEVNRNRLNNDNAIWSIYQSLDAEGKINLAKSMPEFSPTFKSIAENKELQDALLISNDPVKIQNQRAAANAAQEVLRNETVDPMTGTAQYKSPFIASIGGLAVANMNASQFFDPVTGVSEGRLKELFGEKEASLIIDDLKNGSMDQEEMLNAYVGAKYREGKRLQQQALIKDELPGVDEKMVDTDLEANVTNNVNGQIAAFTDGGGTVSIDTGTGESANFFWNGKLILDPVEVPQLAIMYQDWEGRDFMPGYIRDKEYIEVYGPLDSAWLKYQKDLSNGKQDTDRAKFKRFFYDNLSPYEQESSMGIYGRDDEGNKVSLSEYTKLREDSIKVNQPTEKSFGLETTATGTPSTATSTEVDVSKLGIGELTSKPADKNSFEEIVNKIGSGEQDIQAMSEAQLKNAVGSTFTEQQERIDNLISSGQLGTISEATLDRKDLTKFNPVQTEKNSDWNLEDWANPSQRNQYIAYKTTAADLKPRIAKKVPEIKYTVNNDNVVMDVTWNLVDAITGKPLGIPIKAKSQKLDFAKADALVKNLKSSGSVPEMNLAFKDVSTGAARGSTFTPAKNYQQKVQKSYPDLIGYEEPGVIKTKPEIYQ